MNLSISISSNTGDVALVQFSAVLRRHMNGAGFASRYGGGMYEMKQERKDGER